MLELRKYPKAELSALFGTRDTQGLKRKLERYGIVYEEAGRGNTMTFDIKEKHGLSTNLLMSTSKEQNDYSIVCVAISLLRTRESTEW